MTAPSQVAAMSIDVEDWFHVQNLGRVVPRAAWDRCELRVERNVERILGLMAERDVRGTWFVLGWVAERLPALVRRIAAAGHEIGSHGTGHALIPTLSIEEFRADVEHSKKLLEDLTGAEVAGYRAPCFSITDEAIDVLREVGFLYDSSSVAIVAHDRYGRLAGMRPSDSVVEIRSGFHEVPVSCLSVGGHGLPWGGGGYFRLMPYRLFRMGIRRILAGGRPYVFYLHPWEFDPGQPRPAGLRPSERFRHYLNLDRVEGRFVRLLEDFRWSPVRDLLVHRQAPSPLSPAPERTVPALGC